MNGVLWIIGMVLMLWALFGKHTKREYAFLFFAACVFFLWSDHVSIEDRVKDLNARLDAICEAVQCEEPPPGHSTEIDE